MEIPSTILTKFMGDSFENAKVYLFKNKNYDKNAPAHFHIALKTNQDEYLVLSMITSQVEAKIDKNLKDKIIKAIKSSAKVRDEIKNSLGER